MKRTSPAARLASTTPAASLALVLIAVAFAAGCQNINVDTDKLLPPTISNGRTDGRFVSGTNDEVTITDPNDGATVKYSIDGGAAQVYTGPLAIADDATVEAWVEKPGLAASARETASFRLAWRTVAAPATARREAGMVAVGGKLYLFGGSPNPGGGGAVTSCEIYDPGANAWSVGPSLNVGRKDFMYGYIGTTIYAMGGFDASGVRLDSIESMDTAAGSPSWSVSTDTLPAPRIGAESVSAGDRIYVLGGATATGATDTCFAYIPAAESGARFPALTVAPRASLHGAAASDGSTVLRAGGWTDTWTDEADLYSIGGDSWSTSWPNLPQARVGASMVRVDDRFLLFGGGGAFGTSSSIVLAVGASSWSADLSMSETRTFGCAAVIGGEVYVVAGGKTDSALASTAGIYVP